VIRFQTLAARAAIVLLLAAAATAVVAGVGTRLHAWNTAIGEFGIFPYSLYAGLAAFVTGVVWAVTAFCSSKSAGARYGVAAILGALVLFWVPLRDFWMAEVAHAVPPVRDISSDTEHAPDFLTSGGEPAGKAPPRYDGLRRISFEGRSYAEETLQKLYYGDIKPSWQLATTSGKLFQRALSAARSMGWTIVKVAPDDKGGCIQASDTTLLFGLKDDIVIRVRPAGIGARLDIRSRSRDSVSDLGRNAARIRAYLKRLATS
jgi:hypothetical protein